MLVKALTDTATIPFRANDGDAGYDLFADDNYQIPPGEIQKITTGIAFKIPDGYVGVIKDRSSYGSKGLNIVAGVIDQTYTGECIVCLQNNTDSYVNINTGDKIAQMIVLPCYQKNLIEVGELPTTNRGDKGFGSSGL